MIYRWKVQACGTRVGWGLYRRLGERAGRLAPRRTAEQHLGRFVAGRTVADIGCMWNINGQHAFTAEELGADRVVGVDLYVTDEFRAEHARRGSRVEYVEGGADDEHVAEAVGRVDVLWCWGVLYHHPDPRRLLENLTGMTERYLILETVTAPELPGMPNAGVFWPYLPDDARRAWAPSGGARRKLGITEPFRAEDGFANNFWALSPSCIASLLRTVGFRLVELSASPSGIGRHVFVAERAGSPTAS